MVIVLNALVHQKAALAARCDLGLLARSAKVCRVCVKTFVPDAGAFAPVMALLIKGRFFRFHMILLTPHHAEQY